MALRHSLNQTSAHGTNTTRKKQSRISINVKLCSVSAPLSLHAMSASLHCHSV
jgi:hypothetical protein